MQVRDLGKGLKWREPLDRCWTPSLPTRLEQTQSKRNYQQEALINVARKPRLALTPFDPAM